MTLNFPDLIRIANVTCLFFLQFTCCEGHIKLPQRELNPYLRSDSPPYYRYTTANITPVFLIVILLVV